MTDTVMLSVKQQDSILDATAPITCWEGSIRSGKTVASIIAWLLYVKSAPPGPLAMVGKTRDTLARNVLDVIADMHPAAITYTRGAPTCRIVGRLVHVIGANDIKAEGKIRGLTLAGAYVDEITLLQEQFWNQLLGRLSIDGARLFGTTNPDNPAHWFRKNFLAREGKTDLGFKSFHFILDDNPGISEQKKRQYKAQYTGLWYKRFILGLWVAAEGAIYDMLDEQVHCAPAPPRDRWHRGWVAIDYGTSNPTHAVLLVLADDRLHAVAEWRHDGREKGQLTDATISQRLAAWAGPLIENLPVEPHTVLDPSAASLRVQMRTDGWPSIRSADNRVDVGIRNTASLISGGKLVIDQKACPHLWDEMCGYVWDETALQRGEEKPVKTADHGPDALRYGIMAARLVWRHWLPDLAATTELDAA
ncbi:terminase [Amycolatopsis antarctica]|uniref:Terminase n=1 Tax=Amycolatopsis antarctica TaxID=1854586 RepID=A0A263D656_9PSEU|nr:terminase family protein [Amycolatopsis antarctica]OZM73994.1 terminase [Amycolatopsis antarctica]